jgi:small conductance mechanosensitive channel
LTGGVFLNKVFENIKGWLPDNNTLGDYIKTVIAIALIIIALMLISHFGKKIIDGFFSRQKQSRFGFSEKRADTLSGLLKSALRYVLYIFGGLMILEQVGFIKTQTILVGAGLGGIAVGFGAQSLVKDIINGFFILFEDQFSVGEYVTIEGMPGIVENIGLRVTKLKDFSGDLHIIPNGQIGKVSNHSRDNVRALVDIEVGYNADINKALNTLMEICEELKNEFDDIVEGPTTLGIVKLGYSGPTIRVALKVKPMKHWDIEMELRRRIKNVFEMENIIVPYPGRVIVSDDGNNYKG